MEVIRRSSTCAPERARRNSPEQPESRLRLIAKLLRELVTTERFRSFAELKDALRRRLIRLRVRYQQHEFDDAFSLVQSNQRLVEPEPLAQRPAPVMDPPPISRETAARIVAEVRRRTGAAPIKRMPTARLVTQRQVDHARAAQLVIDAIVDQVRICDELETPDTQEPHL